MKYWIPLLLLAASMALHGCTQGPPAETAPPETAYMEPPTRTPWPTPTPPLREPTMATGGSGHHTYPPTPTAVPYKNERRGRAVFYSGGDQYEADATTSTQATPVPTRVPTPTPVPSWYRPKPTPIADCEARLTNQVRVSQALPVLDWSMSTEIDERGRVILLHLNVRNRSDVAISFTQSNRRRFHIFDADTCNEVYRDPSYTTFQAIGPRRIEVEPYGEHVDTFIWYRETTEGNLVVQLFVLMGRVTLA